jgi:hypothetical protein
MASFPVINTAFFFHVDGTVSTSRHLLPRLSALQQRTLLSFFFFCEICNYPIANLDLRALQIRPLLRSFCRLNIYYRIDTVVPKVNSDFSILYQVTPRLQQVTN